ncbi:MULTISPECIES: hypothetical protein [Rhodospirillales]|jgi:hypothetical protein|uniref:Uncharacterized protein n=5 Tax=Thalassospira TaxID=168934 RepID=A0ABR5XYD5_9PROT|nr:MULTISPECIES: hypothetical protein [Thalassospira]MBR9817257.1 hypothetical protein [Rhodospirillales bacterium]PTB87518.1 hypothetical protein C9939_00835 [Pseudidiomarina aestuarii]UKV13325.1 hypothetical protein L6172_14855 [Thalassospiraceae bacterium SW-3-3]HIO00730.1 hypothetical protein [Alphaproteobacteria bacterium]AXO12887.1 hypothetical protein DY252_00425 [Thalassospira indica]|tara:strand:+ start:7298 stop:7507 length:210 start_codon:yes stop_codon:yes gene_type:complete
MTTSSDEQLEYVVLHAFKHACSCERLDIAEFMLRALEKLDQERTEHDTVDRPLMDAYRDLTASSQHHNN